MKPNLDIALSDTAFDPRDPPAHYRVRRAAGQKPTYRVLLFLTGRDLPYVKHVTYKLHPTFPDPVKRVARTAGNPNCSLPIWTWGIFEVVAEVEDKQGNVYELCHRLRYGDDLQNPQAKELA